MKGSFSICLVLAGLLGCGSATDDPKETSSAGDTDPVGEDTGSDCQESMWYADVDLDGFGDAETGVLACEAPDGFVGSGIDCDDTESNAHPGADEVCDLIDNDCDGTVDGPESTDALVWYADSDGDGYGDPDVTSLDCEQPSGTVADASDCDDAASDVYPGAQDTVYDGVDSDCAGDSDYDADGDGFDSADHKGSDCDDADSAINPDAEEVADDGIDNDCVNDAPVVTDVVLSAESAQTNDVLSVTTTAADSDGDAVTVSVDWYVDGDLVLEASETLDGALWFGKGQVVYAEAIAHDGETDGDAVQSASLTVSNTAPEAPEISISPEAPTEGDAELLCQVDIDSQDADGDDVSYAVAWTVGGTDYEDAETTVHDGDTVPADTPVEGEVWVCAVTASDDEEDGGVAEAEVEIGEAESEAVADFSLEDVNDTSATYEMAVSPRDYLEQVSGWYFGHAT